VRAVDDGLGTIHIFTGTKSNGKQFQELMKDYRYLEQEIVDLKKELTEEKKAYNRMYNMYVEKDNIINELHSDLKTLWIVLWNMDTEMTGYQNEVFDKYYDEFHKGSDKE